MTDNKMQLVDWLDDLCVRFIINLPHEELKSVERICFQIEEAQWFYEDFVRPLDPTLPSLNLRKFSLLMFQHCPLSSIYTEAHHAQAYEQFLEYKTRVPVRGAIMLNDDMTQTVLVKGWKKGAKWSFPRGKINKDEPDLDCAVREVYEETGYDLTEAGLVKPDHELKKIEVSMREQNMLLYVFRGVPMDTYFEPRTRKEISKIDWYRLADLPTLKRKNQVPTQGYGQDLLKDNSFYMVAPFLGPLKGWIKQQRKLDRQKVVSGEYLAPPVHEDITVDDDIHGETTADEDAIAGVRIETKPAPDAKFAQLVARLGRPHSSSDALPEVSAQLPSDGFDPAAELKRLLSVGGGQPIQTPAVEAPMGVQQEQPHTNPLLAMLHANSKPNPPLQPHTPYENIISPPQLPLSPHGQHHPRPPHLDHMPPPHFPFHPQQRHGLHQPFMQQQQFIGMTAPIPRNFIPPPPPQSNPTFLSHGPSIHQGFNQDAPRPYQRTGDPEFAREPQFPGLHGPAIPPASKLPPPKLTEHSLNLLNAFKSHEKSASPTDLMPSKPEPRPDSAPRTRQPQLLPGSESFHNQTPPPVQPQPRSAHQTNLLSLFRSPSTSAATPPPPTAEAPVELSAQPTPGKMEPPSAARPPKPAAKKKPGPLQGLAQPGNRAHITSATIKGPLNAPDFETVKKNAHAPDLNGHSRGPSPMGTRTSSPKTVPQYQILKRGATPSNLRPSPELREDSNQSPLTTSNMTTPQAATFNKATKGLKLPQYTQSPVTLSDETVPRSSTPSTAQKHMLPPSSAAAVSHFPALQQAHAAFDRREQLPADQKSTLLSLFSKPPQATKSPPATSTSPFPPQPVDFPPQGLPTLSSKSPMPRSPIPPTRDPHPPTPRSIVSSVISPVSPLHDKSSHAGSPAHLASRSRISSIGEAMPPSVVIPQDLGPAPTSHPTSATTVTQNGNTAVDDGKSPVDKTFLLGFLRDVANSGR
ncbi:hypothetical protein EJ04DRAFT_538993 [Polyplosphaeria fusca]|uniref:Nudix hydrolase domain-containing protein n=1 Tax=Polyplosphaeria fusca TaxID=682080 RepID=A0A9P4QHD7_9PLEO|nr:hypothetical protein EJ04DRAFT_538993 [Polyplosphaeria fusca]